MDIRISQLTNVAAVYNTDLLEISKNIGVGAYDSRKIEFSSVKESVVGKRVVTVSQNTGAMANTIKDGLAIAASMSPTFQSPVAIQVSAGLYNEVNPLIVPSFVEVLGISDPTATVVALSTPNVDGFSLGARSTIKGFALYSLASNVTAVHYNGIGALAQNITVFNAGRGFVSDFSNDTEQLCIAANCKVILTMQLPLHSCSHAFEVGNGSFLTMNSCLAWGVDLTTPIDTAIYVRDDNVLNGVDLYSMNVYGCNYGITIQGGTSYASGSEFGTCNIGINMSGGDFYVTGLQLTEIANYAVQITDSSAVLRFVGSADSSQFSVVSGADFKAQIQDTNPAAPGSRILGKTTSENRMTVGYPGASLDIATEQILDVGEGASYRYDKYGIEAVEYWKYDASAPSGSRFTRYANNAGVQLTDSGDCIIIGSKFSWAAIQLDVDIVADLGSGNIVAEYWNGFGWQPMGIAVYNREKGTHRANNPFQNVETQLVEGGTNMYTDWYADINNPDQIPNWDSTYSMYPVRYRNDGSLTSGMSFTNGLVKGHGWQVSPSKQTLYWGDFRQTVEDAEIISASTMFNDPDIPTASYIANVSPHIKYTSEYGLFTENNVCGVNFILHVPIWVDTSTPLEVELVYMPIGSNTGSVHFDAYISQSEYTNIYNGSGVEATLAFHGNTSGTAYKIEPLPITTNLLEYYNPGIIAQVILIRDDNNPLDTYAGDIAVIRVDLSYTRKLV